jgi:hypothetical protein
VRWVSLDLLFERVTTPRPPSPRPSPTEYRGRGRRGRVVAARIAIAARPVASAAWGGADGLRVVRPMKRAAAAASLRVLTRGRAGGWAGRFARPAKNKDLRLPVKRGENVRLGYALTAPIHVAVVASGALPVDVMKVSASIAPETIELRGAGSVPSSDQWLVDGSYA